MSGRRLSLATGYGEYDLFAAAQRLPGEQAPDAVVCVVDGDGSNLPRNLGAFRCPKVLIVPGAGASAALLRYATAETFDRIIFSGTWCHEDAFRSAGLHNLFWLPGVLFPHGDAALRRAARAERARVVAVSESDERGPGLAGLLAARRVPVTLEDRGPTELLSYYGAALIGLNTADRAEITLNPLSVLAAGAMLLTEPFAAESGLPALWREGREVVVARSVDELVERAQYYLARPDEARGLAAAGARWFIDHLGEKPRQALFRDIVFSARVRPEFELRSRLALSSGASLPPSPAWILTPSAGEKLAQEALAVVARGDLQNGFLLARKALETGSGSLDAYLVMARLAARVGNLDLREKMIARARELLPEDPRLAALERAAAPVTMAAKKLADLLEQGWKAYGAKQWERASARVEEALALAPGWAEAHRLRAVVQQKRATEGKSYQASFLFGEGLKSSRAAVAAEPGRADLWHELGVASRRAGLLPESVEAFRQSLALEPASRLGWFGLGEAHLALDRPELAASAFTQGVEAHPEDSQLLFWLGHARKRQDLWLEAARLHRRALGVVDDAAPAVGARRRAVFIVQHGPMWTNTASVYEAFRADPAWETTLVAAPYLIPAFRDGYDETMAIFDFLRERGIPHVRWDEFPLRPGFADVVFLPNPFDYSRPPEWSALELLKLGPRLAYVPYALEVGGGRDNAVMQWDQTLQRVAWMIFARSERQKASFARHCAAGAAHVVVTGHPRLDLMRDLAAARDPQLEQFAAGRKLVFWNPHLDVRVDGSRFGCGWSTFLHWRGFMVDEFARRPDLAFVIRPHPQLFAKLIEYHVLTQAQIDGFLARCAAAGNIQLDERPSYLPVFAASAAMISDGSSLLLEYPATGKPLLYLHNPGGPGLNADGAFVRDHCQTAETESEIARFLDQVAQGMDPQAAARRQAYGRLMVAPAGGAAAAIKRVVEDRLEAELSRELPRQAEAAPAAVNGPWADMEARPEAFAGSPNLQLSTVD